MAVRMAYNDRAMDASLAGICGAYCGACPVYRAWAEQDRPRLEALATELRTAVDRLICTGCRTPAAFCFGGDCEVKTCAQHRGVAFCMDCEDYPCNRIRRARVGDHIRVPLARDAARLHEVGVTAWLREEDAHWRCSACGDKVAAGMDTCPKCGNALKDL